ncbi:hypothetical protein GCM10010095_62350 [Streptomyces anthocyanicus]|nr:hypothetical protein GCM10010095_62350 [Streptomyces anthocyanicus]
MTTQAQPDRTAEVPAFPQERSARCPFDPPAPYRDWRQTAGLQRARMQDGRQVWMVTRYEEHPDRPERGPRQRGRPAPRLPACLPRREAPPGGLVSCDPVCVSSRCY